MMQGCFILDKISTSLRADPRARLGHVFKRGPPQLGIDGATTFATGPPQLGLET